MSLDYSAIRDWLAIYEPWLDVDGAEGGEYDRALAQAIESALSIGRYEEATTMLGFLRRTVDDGVAYFESEGYEEYMGDWPLRRAKWTDTAEDVSREVLDEAPHYMRPRPGDEVLVADLEVQYLAKEVRRRAASYAVPLDRLLAALTEEQT
jgi:hypothetical protein